MPGPSAWHRARLPLEREVSEALAAVWTTDDAVERSAQGFSDSGSILLGVTVWLGLRLGAPVSEVFSSFQGSDPIEMQTWMPPAYLWESWYREELVAAGLAHTYEPTSDPGPFADALEANQTPVPRSPMARFGLTGIDAMASVVHRHPLPLHGLVERLRSE